MALLFQKVGLVVPDGDGAALYLKQRHINVRLFPIQSSGHRLIIIFVACQNGMRMVVTFDQLLLKHTLICYQLGI